MTRPILYCVCKVCKVSKPKIKSFVSTKNRSVYRDVCKECEVPYRMRGTRVMPVFTPTPGIETNWIKDFYVPHNQHDRANSSSY